MTKCKLHLLLQAGSMTFWGWLIQCVFAFYFSLKFWSQTYDVVLLKTLLRASINEFSIWLCSADPDSSFPFSGSCSHWCPPSALKVHLVYALPVVFGADLETKWKIYIHDLGVWSQSLSQIQVPPFTEVSSLWRTPRGLHDTACPCPLSSLNS